MGKVRINQVGFLPSAVKYAVFADLDSDDNSFQILDSTGKIAYSGDIPEGVFSEESGERNATCYFTNLKEPGTYRIVTAKGESSYEFTISDRVYDKTFKAINHMLFLQRCGCVLSEEEAGIYAHEACHNSLAEVYGTTTKIDVTGGWHDAGDYGRYVVSGVQTIADLFLAYDFNPKAFEKIDVLAEAKFELDWLFKMQDSVTGGVYHKVTCESFPGFVMPQFETEKLVVCPISNTATGDFAAIMAWASVVYKDDAGFAKKCLDAAVKAYDYVVAHQNDPGFKNPEGIVTGEYPDDNCFDEIMWAAVELYKVTGEEKYFDTLKSAAAKVDKLTLLGWDDMGGFAVYSALTCDSLLKNHGDFVEELRSKFFEQIEEKLSVAKKHPYMISRKGVYEWGSNMGVANDAMILIMADKICANQEYKLYAAAMMDYLFGANATDYCFVTGEGSNSPKNPHHRPSAATGKAMPGMLVGGPDNGLHDPCAENNLKGLAPAKCYIDHVESYSTNEICVYWNSPLIALMAMLNFANSF